MSEQPSDLKRVLSSSGIYAAATALERGLAFFLLPIYTRFIDPVEYGTLEILTAFSAVAFSLLSMGLPAAINKCYHRDCETPADRARVLATSLWLALPVLSLGGGLLFSLAPQLSRWFFGTDLETDLVRLVVCLGIVTSIIALSLSSLRSQERAVAYTVITLAQFLAAATLNLALVMHYEMGVRGVLWGNLVSNVLALPLALLLARRGAEASLSRRLVAPMLRFGFWMIPVALTAWVINLSDRYFLRHYADLTEVAIYGVGYRFGMIIELAIVWPFQLAWPAVSFSISNREGHRRTYARTLTYMTFVLTLSVLALSLLARIGVPLLVGAEYRDAYRVVPLVALAYAFNGILYCVGPGIHLTGKTRYLAFASGAAACLNLGLNFLLIPSWGMMGAAWATAGAFFLATAITAWVAQTYYPVPYEYGRVLKMIAVGGIIFAIGVQLPTDFTAAAVAWHLFLGVAAFPIAVAAMGLIEEDERGVLRDLLRRLTRPGSS